MGAAEKQESAGTVVTLLTEEQLRKIVRAEMEDALKAQKGEGYFDARGAAQYLGTTVNSVRNAVNRGQLVPDHRGQRGQGLKGNRFSRETLDAWMKRKPIG